MERSIYQLLVTIIATLLLTVGVPVEVLAGYNDYGITATQGGVVIREKTISVNDANVNRTYTLFAKLPANVDPNTVSWQATGGIEIVSQTKTRVVVRSKKGTTYQEKYSRYAAGALSLTVTRTEDPDNSCDCAPLCNPISMFSVVFYKSFDIVKTINGVKTILNPIKGPDCANPGDTVTFSVEPWVSMMLSSTIDTYNWTVTPASYVKKGSRFFSADNSSMTFVVNETIPSVSGLKLSVSIGKSNNHTLNTKTLSDAPEAPVLYLVDGDTETLIMDNKICIPARTSGFRVRVANYNPSLTYEWGVGAWTCVDEGNGYFSFIVTNGEKVITLEYGGTCGKSSYAYKVGRSLIDGLSVVDLLDNTCFTPKENVTLKLGGPGDGLDLHWATVSNEYGWTFEPGDRVMPSATVGRGPLTVAVHSNVCNVSDVRQYTLNVPPAMPAIDNSFCMPYGSKSEFEFEVPDDANTQSWEWRVANSDWTINSIDTLRYRKVSVSTKPINYSTTLYVKAKGYGGCGYSEEKRVTLRPQYGKPELTVTHCDVNGNRTTVGGSATVSINLPNEKYRPSSYIWNLGGLEKEGVVSNTNFRSSSLSYEVTVPVKDDASYVVSVSPYNSYGCDEVSTSTTSHTITPVHFYNWSTEYDDSEDGAFQMLYLKNGIKSNRTTKTINFYLDGELIQHGSAKDAAIYDRPIGSKCNVRIEVAEILVNQCRDVYEFQVIVGQNASSNYNSKSGKRALKSVSNRLAIDQEENVSEQGQNKALLMDENGETQEEWDFEFYPNPTKGLLNVKMTDDMPYEIRIYTRMGALITTFVGEGDTAALDLSYLNEDFYVCHIKQNGNEAGKLFRLKK